MSKKQYDLTVIGGGINGGCIALFAARRGMKVCLVERDKIACAASGVNAGTLTMQMTRVQLIPYALRAHDMWARAKEWLGHDVGVVVCDGLSLAFSESEEEMLKYRSQKRRDAGAPISLVSGKEALVIEPGLSKKVRMASHCTVDGFANAYLTGVALKKALLEADVTLIEDCEIEGVEKSSKGYSVISKKISVKSSQIVLAGGVWLQSMMKWFGIDMPIKVLTNQLAVTERSPPAMRTVLGIASGLLSLKQYPHGTTVIGGGWQGRGDRKINHHEVNPESLVGNVRLAQYAIPALAQTRLVRSWTGFEAETQDALPAVGPIPGYPGAWVCGSIHSGYTSGPYIAHCLTQAVLGEEPDLPLFPIERLLQTQENSMDVKFKEGL